MLDYKRNMNGTQFKFFFFVLLKLDMLTINH